MLGAILGDIIGSPYEFGSPKSKCFPLFDGSCRPTDDSILTIAVGCACVDALPEDETSFKLAVEKYLRELGRQYPDAGFGERFYQWMMQDHAGPYFSAGNGSAMRVSPVAWAARTLEEAECLAEWSAEVTHDHPDGRRGAMAVAAAIFLAREQAPKEQIRAYISENYYPLDFTLDEIRPTYTADLTCAGSVPQAIVCFLEAEDFEDAVRNAVSLGGDGDTLAAMAGSIAEAYYDIPEELQWEGLDYLDDTLTEYYEHYADTLYGN